MYFAYIIQSEKSLRYYTGSAANLEDRLNEHNHGETISTKNGIPWRLIHIERFESRSEALNKEKEIKSRGAKRYLEDISRKQLG